MKISVVIPVHVKHKNDIKNTLMSLALQYRKPDEVILILSPHNSEFRHYIESLAKNNIYNVKIITTKSGIGAARRIGVEMANGDVVAFIDADEVAHPCWLKNIEEFFADPNKHIVTGPVYFVKETELDPDILAKNLNQCRESQIASLTLIDFAPTANLAFRKSIINAVGNFDEKLVRCHEDTDFMFRLKKAKINTYFSDNIVVYHKRRANEPLIRRIKNAFFVGLDMGYLFMKHPRESIKLIRVEVGNTLLLMLTILLFLTLHEYTLSIIPLLLSLSYKLYKYLKKRPNNIAWIIISYLSDIAYTIGFFIRMIKETFIWISLRFR